MSLDNQDIGMGLFSHKRILKGSIIGFYKGENVDAKEFQRRRLANLGGYGIRMSKTKVKDCRKCYEEGTCLMSASNSANKLKYKSTGALVNCRTRINASLTVHRRKAYLRATRDIAPHEEILTLYSKSFWY